MTARKEFIPISSREVSKKDKLNLRLDRTDVKEDKKTVLSQKDKSKKNSSRKCLSKPASAREKKMSKKNKLI